MYRYSTIWFTLWNCKSDWNCKNERNKKNKKFSLAKGIRTIDTARSYGLNAEGEKRLAKIGIDEFITLAKLPVSEPGKNRISWVVESIKESLKNLKLKKFNTVFVHNVNFLFDKKGNKIYEGLIKAKKIGLLKILAFQLIQ